MSRTIADLDWPVTTARLRIRPTELGDATAMFAYRSQESVARWSSSWPQDPATWAAGFDGQLDDTLAVEDDGVLVGDLSLHVGDGWAQHEVKEQAVSTVAEIGYALDPAYVGQGYATEAVRALLDIAFDGIGVRRVVAECFADNESSWKLMERVGMRRETHRLRESLHRSGGWVDGLGYALLREEWLARRDRDRVGP